MCDACAFIFRGFSAICHLRADVNAHRIYFLQFVGILKIRDFWKFSMCIDYMLTFCARG